MFTIHAFVWSVMLPLVLTLLLKRDREGDRDKDTYTTYQSSPRDMSAPQQDHITILHVRQPGRNAVVETFPAAELKGCLFHY